MAEEKTGENPFSGFNLLDGGFGSVVADDSQDDDVVAGDDTIIKEEAGDDLGTSAADADKLLEEVAKKQAEAKIKKTTTVVDDTLESNEDSEEVEETSGAGFKPALSHLSDKGILDFNDADIEDSEDGFEKAINQTINNKFEKLLTNKLGEDGLALLNFVENGGNPKHFIETYYNDASWEDYSIEDESSQKVALRESLRSDKYEPEDIEDIINEYTDNGTLEKHAKKHLAKLQKLELTEKAQLVELQKAQAIKDKQSEKKYWDDFKSNILSKEEIKGFKLTPKVKENLVNFFTVTDRSGKTGYQKAVESDSDAALLFGLQAMNNFDISKLEKQVMTKTASKLNGIMKNYQSNSKDKISSGRTDFQPEGTDPFAGFKKMQ